MVAINPIYRIAEKRAQTAFLLRPAPFANLEGVEGYCIART
jgi:hypothetical protein